MCCMGLVPFLVIAVGYAVSRWKTTHVEVTGVVRAYGDWPCWTSELKVRRLW